MGVLPPLLPKRTMRMLKGRMGPVCLHNMASKICKLYVRTAQEEPNCTPNVQEAQDLNLCLHLWNVHKQEKSDLIHIMKGWRPPTWAIKVMKQKKLVLRERGKAQVAQQKGSSLPQHKPLLMMDTPPKRSITTSSGIVPTPHLPLLRDWLASPEPSEVAMQGAVMDQYPHHLSMASPLPCTTNMSSTAAPLPKGRARASQSPMMTFHQTCTLSLLTLTHGHISCTNGSWG